MKVYKIKRGERIELDSILGLPLASANQLSSATPSPKGAFSSGNSPLKNPVIAVTGKMASGKNYVCKLLEQSGWNSIDADLLVHEAINQSADLIYKTFQPYESEAKVSIKNPDGSINRRALGIILFSKPELMAVQESIVYPIITKKVQDFIQNHNKTIINATVLFKTPDLLNLCSSIVFVSAPLLVRIKRAARRDNMPLKQILKRFYTQRNLLKEYKKTGKPIIFIKNN